MMMMMMMMIFTCFIVAKCFVCLKPNNFSPTNTCSLWSLSMHNYMYNKNNKNISKKCGHPVLRIFAYIFC